MSHAVTNIIEIRSSLLRRERASSSPRHAVHLNIQDKQIERFLDIRIHPFLKFRGRGKSCYRIRNTFSVQQLPAERMQLFSHDRIVITNGYSICVHFLTRNHMHFNTLYHKTERKTTLKDLQKSELSIVILPEGVFSSQLFNFY